MSKISKNVEEVFGRTFKRYSKKEILEFIDPFKIRLKKNKINATKLFKGKECLDLGCGNGRGSLFMATYHARTLNAIDLSKSNVITTKKVLKQFAFKIKVQQSRAEKISYRDNTFDFIWCNGVIMHAHRPSSVISEIYRVLKPGGKAWIFVYGAGGLWVSVISRLRSYFSNIQTNKIIRELSKMGYSNRYIGEFIDDWKVLNLRTYQNLQFQKGLRSVGFKKILKLNRGLNYDTSEKLFQTKNKRLYGEGDLRYLVTKSRIKKNANVKRILRSLDKSYKYSESIFNKYLTILDKLLLTQKRSINEKIHIGATIQFTLRRMLDKKFFNEKVFYNFLKRF